MAKNFSIELGIVAFDPSTFHIHSGSTEYTAGIVPFHIDRLQLDQRNRSRYDFSARSFFFFLSPRIRSGASWTFINHVSQRGPRLQRRRTYRKRYANTRNRAMRDAFQQVERVEPDKADDRFDYELWQLVRASGAPRIIRRSLRYVHRTVRTNVDRVLRNPGSSPFHSTENYRSNIADKQDVQTLTRALSEKYHEYRCSFHSATTR